MGRRIPKSRRHKKIKAVDPFYRGERKFSEKEDKKLNVKPLNPNDQEIPKKVKEIMEVQQTFAERFKRKRRKKTLKVALEYNEGDDYGPGVKGCEREPQAIPKFQKIKGENDQAYIKRIHFSAMNAVTQAKLEKKFDVSYAESEEGKTVLQKPSSLPLDKNLPASMKRVTTTNKKLKRKKLKEVKKEKRLAKLNKRQGDFDHLKDDIKFGMVVDRPPVLSVLPRKAAMNSKASAKPARKSLLLNKLLHSTESSDSSNIDLSKRRKYLSVAIRRKLDTERDMAIQAYRKLKLKQTSATAS